MTGEMATLPREPFQDSEQLSDAFFQRLSKDREFSTLVLEAIERERRWADLLGKDFKSFWGEATFSL